MRSRPWMSICALAALTLAGCAPAEDPRRSVIVIVVDTLRADHLGLYGYGRETSPMIDARAEQAAVFERAFSSSSWTLPAMGSMFTSRVPTRHGAGIVVHDASGLPSREEIDSLVGHARLLFYQLDGSLPTLAEHFREAGYATAAIANNSFLAPDFGLDRGFDDYDLKQSGSVERPANVAVDSALDWLAGHEAQAPGEPFFLFLHLIDPHMPYAAPQPFQGMFVSEFLEEGEPVSYTGRQINAMRRRSRAGGDEGDRARSIQVALYDEEIAFSDRELGRFFDALDARGLSDEATVLLTSDHGEEFLEHGKFEHGNSMYNELIRIPLMVWGPEVRPGRYQLPASLVDVMPTLLDANGLALPEDTEGVSMWPVLTDGPPSPVTSPIPFDRLLFAERTLYGDERKAVISWPWKAWVNVTDNYAEIFNLDRDFAEQDDERAAEADRYYTLLAALQEKMAAANQQQGATEVTLDERMLEDLRALGYIR